MRLFLPLLCVLGIGLSGCFVSAGSEDSECTDLPGCPEGTLACTSGTEGCEPTIICDELFYCALPPAQCAAVPVCGRFEVEVSNCEVGSTSCHAVEACGATILCDTCDVGDVCDGDILREEPCNDEGPACRNVEACGEVYICQARPQCSSGVQVAGPEECEAETTCFFEDYFVDEEEVRVWCTGSVAECFALPTCESDEDVIELLAPCPDDAECHYATTCGQTVQCALYLSVDG